MSRQDTTPEVDAEQADWQHHEHGLTTDDWVERGEDWFGAGDNPFLQIAEMLDHLEGEWSEADIRDALRHTLSEYDAAEVERQVENNTQQGRLVGYALNNWTQPIHLFVDGSDEAVCGISLQEANNQDGVHERGADSFPASNNFESYDQLRGARLGEDHHCEDCWQEEFDR